MYMQRLQPTESGAPAEVPVVDDGHVTPHLSLSLVGAAAAAPAAPLPFDQYCAAAICTTPPSLAGRSFT
jgi:hypothetical protein